MSEPGLRRGGVTGCTAACETVLMQKILLGPDPTYLPDDHPDMAAREALESGDVPREVAARFPAASYPWELLAREAMSEEDPVAAYAYARTGYHRGLDALRQIGRAHV